MTCLKYCDGMTHSVDFEIITRSFWSGFILFTQAYIFTYPGLSTRQNLRISLQQNLSYLDLCVITNQYLFPLNFASFWTKISRQFIHCENGCMFVKVCACSLSCFHFVLLHVWICIYLICNKNIIPYHVLLLCLFIWVTETGCIW